MSKRKRQPRKKKVKPPKRRLNYYPVVFCLEENKTIGLSKLPLRLKADKFGRIKVKDKVGSGRSWYPEHCKFIKEYELDLNNYKDGETVVCPKCGGPVDFRAFPSSTVPELRDEEDSKNNPEEPPAVQSTDD